jgi:hypothetical protein
MHYVCLVYFDQEEVLGLEGDELETCIRESGGYDAELMESGHMVLGHALARTSEAITVRVRDGKMSATDGPFAETREVLGGFIVVEARDLNEAVRIAAGIPLARRGAIEVRPTMGGPNTGGR